MGTVTTINVARHKMYPERPYLKMFMYIVIKALNIIVYLHL